jgi:hypothetical protein
MIFSKYYFDPLTSTGCHFQTARARKLRLGSFSSSFQALFRFHHFNFDSMLDRVKYESTTSAFTEN